MAFGAVTARGTNNSTSSGTTLVVTPSGTITSGSLALICTAWDNEGTSDAETTQLSVTDSVGNTWTRARERTNGAAGANSGSTAGLFYSVLTTQLTTSDSVTITSTSARTSKAAALFGSTTGGSGVNLETNSTTGESDGSVNDYVSGGATIGSLSNVEHLFINATAVEGNSVAAYTEDADYGTPTTVTANTGVSASSMTLVTSNRIFTGTTDTWDPSGDPGANAVDVAWCYVAFTEASGGADGTATPSVVAAIAAVGSVTTTGTALVIPSVVAALSAVGSPTTSGTALVQPSVVAAVCGVGAPTVSGGGLAAPSVVAAVAGIPAPTLTGSAVATPSVLEILVDILSPVFEAPPAVIPRAEEFYDIPDDQVCMDPTHNHMRVTNRPFRVTNEAGRAIRRGI